MLYIYRLIIFSLILYGLTTNQSTIAPIEVMCFLLLAAVELLKARFFPERWMAPAEWLFLVIISFFEPIFSLGFALLLPEVMRRRDHIFVSMMLLIFPALLLTELQWMAGYLLFLSVCGFVAYLVDRLKTVERQFRSITNGERRTIYKLEKSKTLLQKQAEERIHLAELKERNRIARDLHDTVGHRIAGLYMQLQAASKIKGKDQEKSDRLIEKTIGELSETLTLIRNTAHDMVPHERTGLEKLRQIINSFSYCETAFASSGALSSVPDTHWRVLEASTREALTNIFKHSGATQVRIELTGNRHFVRLYIKDNGKGAPVVQHHLGLSGMTERVKQLGGNLSIDGRSGFMIVCLLPLTRKEGEIFERAHR